MSTSSGQLKLVLGRFPESIPDDSIILTIFAGEREDSSKTSRNRFRLATSPKLRWAKKTSLQKLLHKVFLLSYFHRRLHSFYSTYKWKLIVNMSLIFSTVTRTSRDTRSSLSVLCVSWGSDRISVSKFGACLPVLPDYFLKICDENLRQIASDERSREEHAARTLNA
jgi:hypothetical protein